jgi:hypothetical protein
MTQVDGISGMCRKVVVSWKLNLRYYFMSPDRKLVQRLKPGINYLSEPGTSDDRALLLRPLVVLFVVKWERFFTFDKPIMSSSSLSASSSPPQQQHIPKIFTLAEILQAVRGSSNHASNASFEVD